MLQPYCALPFKSTIIKGKLYITDSSGTSLANVAYDSDAEYISNACNNYPNCVKILNKISDFNDGKGEYDFSTLSDSDKENKINDEWNKIREELDSLIIKIDN